MQKIGSLFATSVSNHLDENFYVPDGMDSSVLGISIQSSQATLATNAAALFTNAAQLKFTMRLYQEGASNEFYRAQIFARSNCVYYPLWKPDLGYLITGVEPFPYARPDVEEVVAGAYRFGRDTFPLLSGRPRPGVNYRVTVTIDTPVPITNRFQLWLYSYKNTKTANGN